MRQITHVLLVEDDSVDRLHVLRLLGRSDDPQQHFDVKHSVRLQDALDLLGKGDVDVVLLDLRITSYTVCYTKLLRSWSKGFNR